MRAFTAVCFLLVVPTCWAVAGSFPLARDGQPAATIVVAKDACRAVRFAAQELQDHVRKISSAVLPVVSDEQPVAGPRVLIGESAATRKLGLRGSQCQPQEGLIRFLPDTLVLLGRDRQEPAPSNVMVTGSPQWVPGKFGSALQFTGSQALTVMDCGFADNAGSMECWVNFNHPTKAAEETLLRLDGSSGGWTYHILRRLPDDSVMYVIYDGTNGYSVVSKPLPAGWHHLLATHDTATQKIELSVDGASAGTAQFTKTGCQGAALGIGGIAGGAAGNVGNPYTGLLDEVRLSTALVRPALSQAPAKAPETTNLLHLDEGQGAPVDIAGSTRFAPPDGFEDQGSLYATHDFLERYCGVRWYGPGELGLVCPHRLTLTVQGADLRRKPALSYRDPYPGNGYGLQAALWGNPSAAECRVFWSRMKAGGTPYGANHSFYGYYDRFYEKNPQKPDLFEAAHPEWFAQGYTGKPNQMCFTNPGFVQQVTKDANDYFDGKGLKPGGAGRGEYFGYVPMDANGWCKCPVCQPLFDQTEKDNPQFSNGKASDYMFHCANLVARELRRTHPDKYLATLAYWEYAYYPRQTGLQPNISVQMCLHVRNWWDQSMEKNDMKLYRDWVDHEGKRRPLYLWLYYCFPEEVATNGRFHCFPGFFAHTLDRQIKMFAKDGIRGAFFNGLGEQLDTYLTFQLLDDPTQNVDKLLDEFFTGYYGAAAEPMKRLYLRIEQIYMDPKSYPEAVQRGDHHTHQTEEIAWGYLGTEQRMAELAGYMGQAKAVAQSEVERQRVTLFERGIWDYMVEGRQQWVQKAASNAERDKLKARP